MTDLLLATTNAGKRREFGRLLAHLPGRVVGPEEAGVELDVPEPFHTYHENARAKAEAYARVSGLLTLADDSGLEVAALDWGPGVRTGRYGGPDVADKVAYLLEQLRDVTDRRCRMVCVLALAIPGAGEPRIELFSGVMQGIVATRPRGEGGFGYDPIFLLPAGITTAELPEDEKDRLSHRGRAVQAATPRLVELLAG
ncbi:MAG TPA: non-canonical purine NTP pyrophosphatase [Candidatus Limnocylindria bacterium]|nr:non-canonical purine NTP pyrophosphatase [Candidatus Limnocylindria bacterium]